ncbi:MAG: signal peptidase I [Elusimicrobiota bacterium]
MEIKLFIAGLVTLVITLVLRQVKKRKPSLASSKVFSTALDWLETIWSSVLLASVIMYFVVQAFKIPSGSMRQTLVEGDHLFVNKFIYGFQVPLSGGKRVLPLRQIRRKDIVIFKCPPDALTPQEREKGVKKDFIKRAVGLPGDTVEIKNKKLYVNGVPVDEPYTSFETEYLLPNIKYFKSAGEYRKSWENGVFVNLPVRDNFGPVTVPQGCYFVLGDNRDKSFDSRFWGPLEDKYVKGQALVIYWPVSRIRVIR